MIKLKDMIKEGEIERQILDSLTKIIGFHTKMNGIQILKARSNKDEFGGYVWDFWLSEPLPNFELDNIKDKLKNNNPFINQNVSNDGQVRLRILVG